MENTFGSPAWMANIHRKQLNWPLVGRIAWWVLLTIPGVLCWAATKEDRRVRYGTYAAVAVIAIFSLASEGDAEAPEAELPPMEVEAGEGIGDGADPLPEPTLEETADSSDLDDVQDLDGGETVTTEAPATTTTEALPVPEAVVSVVTNCDNGAVGTATNTGETTLWADMTIDGVPVSNVSTVLEPGQSADFFVPSGVAVEAGAAVRVIVSDDYGYTNEAVAFGQDCAPAMTFEQEQAIGRAESYLRYSAFSRAGLISQLEFEGFSNADATFAVDNVSVDWFEQSALKAESYLSYSSFSRTGLIGQLEFEKFTAEQAEYAVNAVTVDWFDQAVLKAGSYLEYSSFSRDRLVDQLIFEGFTAEQAEHGVAYYFD